MEIRELRLLILEGESQVLDFKQRTPQAYKIAKTMVSFANTRGGRILIGVLDSGEIIGTDPEEQLFQLEKAASYYCRPSIALDFAEIEDDEGNIVLIAEIHESEQKPHSAQDKNGNWHVYVRSKDESVLAGETVVQMLKKGITRSESPLNTHEKQVIAYLEKNRKVTSKQAAKFFNLSERRAKRMLVELTRSGLLLSHDFEKEVFYTIA